MKKLKQHFTKKNIVLAIVLFGLVVALLLLAYFAGKKMGINAENAGQAPTLHRTAEEGEELQGNPLPGEVDEVSGTLYYNGKQYIRRDDLSTLLILGIDDPELQETDSVRNTSQADLILVAVFDPVTENCTVIQLNRDTMCDLPFRTEDGRMLYRPREQLALAHTYGNGLEESCENTVYAVSRLLYDVPIDNYFALTMDAIPTLTNVVGGVTVHVVDDFTGVDDSLIQGETVTLTSENAENFVRSRKGMPDNKSNLNRMARQREYMVGFVKALKEAISQNQDFVLDAYVAVSDSLVTDCTINELSDLGSRFSEYDLSEIISPPGESVSGEKFLEYNLDEEALQELVLDVFYEAVE